MKSQVNVLVNYAKGDNINGMGMMIGQYLEQNLDEFAGKVKQAGRLNVTTSVEVEKGISTTVRFKKGEICIENGVAPDTHLHLKSSYMAFADVLTGKLSPVKGVVRKEIKIKKVSLFKTFQAMKLLSFLKLPPELLSDQNRPARLLGKKRMVWGISLAAIMAIIIMCFYFTMHW